jgi:hypothetical protein
VTGGHHDTQEAAARAVDGLIIREKLWHRVKNINFQKDEASACFISESERREFAARARAPVRVANVAPTAPKAAAGEKRKSPEPFNELFRGVLGPDHDGKFKVKVRINNGRVKSCFFSPPVTYATAQMAAEAHDRFARDRLGAKAIVNFTEDDPPQRVRGAHAKKLKLDPETSSKHGVGVHFEGGQWHGTWYFNGRQRRKAFGLDKSAAAKYATTGMQ